MKNPFLSKTVNPLNLFLTVWFVLSVVAFGFLAKHHFQTVVYERGYNTALAKYQENLQQANQAGYLTAINELMTKASETCDPLTIGNQENPEQAIQMVKLSCLNTEAETEASE